MKNCFYAVMAGLILLSTTVNAGTEADWAVRYVKVVALEHFYKSSNAVLRVIYETNENSIVPGESFGCSVNTTPMPGYTNRYYATYWNTGTNSHHQMELSMLLYAKAQNLHVDLLFDPSGCNTATSYGYSGLGRRYHGSRLSQQ